ncbi:MAG TPA: hypothetical protein DCZ03_06180 [Gammaproteobacteria bacterium]|nr:hypothetical protein [Gammaproteobacteria bacterium]
MSSSRELIEKLIAERMEEFAGQDLPDSDEKILLGIKDDASWVISLKGGVPQANEGTTDDALVTILFSDNALPILMNEGSDGNGMMDQMTQMNEMIAKADTIRESINGTLKLVIKTEDGNEETLAIGFCGLDYDSPTTTITMPIHLMQELSGGSDDAQPKMMQAFMAGDIQLDGDMGFVMNLQSNLDLGMPGM